MSNTDADVSFSCDDGRSVINESIGTTDTVSLDRRHTLQTECAKLRIEVAKISSISEEHESRARDKEAEIEAMRAEMEVVRRENERLSDANEHLRRRVDILTVDEQPGDEISQEVIEDIRVLRTKIESGDVLDHEEVAGVIKDIRDCTRRKLQKAAVDRCDLEAENQSLERQRDDWKFEAERLAIEMNEMEERLGRSDAERTRKRLEDERDEWKSMVEQLAVELNETKRQRDEWKFETERLTAAMDQLKLRLQEGDVEKMDEQRDGWKSMVEHLAVELSESKRQRDEWKLEAERLAADVVSLRQQLKGEGDEETSGATDDEREGWKSMVEQLAVELNESKRQRDEWKSEAEKLTEEIGNVKEQLRERDAMAVEQPMDEEREGWKSMVEQLAVELNESKREREEIAQKIGHKESEIMDMVNQINEDVNEVVIKKGISEVNACCQHQNKLDRKGLVEARLRALGSSGWRLTGANKRQCPQSPASV